MEYFAVTTATGSTYLLYSDSNGTVGKGMIDRRNKPIVLPKTYINPYVSCIRYFVT
jgi:hypothetical protein